MKITVKIHPHNTAELNQLAEALKMLTFLDKKDKVEEVKEQAPVVAMQPAPAVEVKPVAKPAAEVKPKSVPAPITARVATSAPVVDPAAPAAPVAAAPVAAAPVAVSAEEGKTIDKSTITALVQTKIQAGFREDIVGYLAKVGAKNVSAVDPSNYNEFYELLNSLK